MAKPSGPQEPKTGDDFIEKARAGGAVVHEPRNKKGTEFVQVETRQGSVWIAPGKQPLDKRTRKNYKHWFRLLGLLVFLALCAIMIDAYLYAEGVRISL